MEEAQWFSLPENLWIAMARAGDLPAFNQLVLAHQDAAFRVARWIVQDDACAEDIVQTVFLTAYRRIGSFRGGKFRPWLLTMVRNACIDELRRRKRQPCLTLALQECDGESVKTAQWPIDAQQTPEETLIQHETWEWIEQCLRRLPEPMREAVILIDIEGLDYGEAANTLGIPLGTLKSRLGRARARMRGILREADPGPEAQAFPLYLPAVKSIPKQ